ncbi:MAG: metal-dependent transcriptional regulator [Nitrospiraceae bacterium]|nr:metal-dependent transcriptional regulator [Nitrospiraceae bacterium]
MMSSELSASLEDYLEAIHLVIQDRDAVRSKDIAAKLGVSTASVTGALRALAFRGLINYEPYGVIALTGAGRKVAKDVTRNHEALREFLVKVLSVPPEAADATACKMEHVVPDDVMERFVGFVEFMERCPYFGAVWDESLGFRCESERDATSCAGCLRLPGSREEEVNEA